MSASEIRLDGGIAALVWKASAGAPGVVVVHGYGSSKENHADFAEHVAARGMAAIAIDLPGHGETGGDLGPAAFDAVASGISHLSASGYGPIGVRGSSLGGFLALTAPLRAPEIAAIVAICPARPEFLAERLESDWPLAVDLDEAARIPGIARGYWHATGDDRVPWGGTFRLAGLSPSPVRLRVEMGGGHTTLQHDPEVLRDTADFLARHLGADG